MDEVRNRLSACFAAVFPDLPEAELPKASLYTVKGWDSVATITLVTLCEQEFQIQIPVEDLKGFTSFELILAYVQPKVAAR